MTIEYSLYFTYKCNLRCSFCFVKERLSNQLASMTDKEIDTVIQYILEDNPKANKIITFLGGEPLADYKIMDKFIKKTRKFGWKYQMYTNGLLLNKVPIRLLRQFDIILISIDGDRHAQEKHRGRGTYERVLKNIELIRPQIHARVIGRITATEDGNLFKSVANLIQHTDAVYWQIVNKPEFINPRQFIKKYKAGIKKLFTLWLSNLKKGKLLNIIPFQVIFSALLFDFPKHKLSFRCNAGHSLKIIDKDGRVFWCDEYAGSPKAFTDSVYSPTHKLIYKKHTDIFADCKTCNVSDICRGRCRRCLTEYSSKHVREYCEMTEYLIQTLLEHKVEISHVLKNNHISRHDFYDDSSDFTEKIP